MAKILRGYLFPAYEIKINVELFENVNFIFFLIGLIINPFSGGHNFKHFLLRRILIDKSNYHSKKMC